MTAHIAFSAAAPELCRSWLQAGMGALVQSTLLLGLGLLAGRMLQSRGPALQSLVYRATMATVVTVALVSLLLAGSFRALWRVSLPPAPHPAVETRAAPAPTGGREAVTLPVPAAEVPAIPKITSLPRRAPEGASRVPRAGGGFGWVYAAATGAWAGGTILLLAWVLFCHLCIGRLRRSSDPIRDGDAATTLRALCHSLGVRQPLLLSHPRVQSPFLVGLWRPAILLPSGYEAEFEGAGLRAILAHELTHLARWDCGWNLLSRAVCAALWVQPLAWLLARRLEHAGEEVCDQRVLELEGSPRVYAGCLMRLAERLLPSRPERAAGVGVVPFRSSLGRRLERILDGSRRQPLALARWWRAAVALGAAGSVVAGVHLVSAASPRPEAPVKAAGPNSTIEKPVGGPVSGRVITPDGKPVAEATVSWISRSDQGPSSPASVRTDAAGRFRFADTTPFRHKEDYPELMVEAAGWGLSYQKLPEGGEPVEISLDPATELRVSFVDQADKPVPGLKVSPSLLLGGGGRLLWFPAAVAQRLAQRTDANGAAAFPSLPQGHQLRLAVEAERFAQLGDQGVLHLSSGPATQAQPIRLQAGASLQGRITFGPTGKPAVGIKVGAQGMGASDAGGDAVTDVRGEYRITQLRAAAYNVALSLNGATARSWTARAHEGVTVHAGERMEGLDFQLVRGAEITGKAVAEDTRTPIPGLFIGVYGPAHPQSSAWVQNTQTAPDGTYLLRVPGGKQHLYVESLPPPGYLKPARDSRELTVRDGETVTVDFKLPRGTRIQPVHGRVLGSDGRPVAWAEVWITSAGPGGTETVETDAAGSFVLKEQQLSQTVTLHARRGNLATPAGTIVTGRGDVTLRLRKDVLASLSGHVTNPAGQPIAGAQISLIAWTYDTGSGSVVTQSDQAGRYMLPALWPDLRYSVSATASGFGHKDSDRMEVKPGEAREVPPLVLQVADRSVAGRVVDERGDPIVGAQVDLDGRETASQMKASESEGRFRFDTVVNEKVSVSAQFPGYEWVRKSVPAGSTGVTLVLTSTKSAKATPSQSGRDEQEHFAAMRGRPAPPLRAVAWVNSPPQSLAQLRGKVVLIDFWGIGCGPCVAALPGVQRAAEQFAGKGVVIIGLHGSGTSPAELRRFARQHHLTYPLAIDAPDGQKLSFGQTFRQYAVQGIPSVAVIDRRGRVAYMGTFLDEAVGSLGPLLAQSSPAPGRGSG